MYHVDLPRPGRKPGGVAVHVHRLSEALSHRGHSVTVLTYSEAEPAAYRTVRLRPHRAERSRIIRQYVASWGFNALSFSEFDVAHFHGDDWFFVRRRLPTVRTFHGSALLESRSAASWQRRIDKLLVFQLEKLASRLTPAIYGVGPDSEFIFHARGLLPLGVELAREPRQPSARPSIMFIGTWAGRKRGKFLYEVFQHEVVKHLPNAELWMVSDECRVGEGVRWIPAPSDEDIGTLLSQAWVFCLPSTYEGFGIPYLEAMAHGAPVVATPNPGSRSMLQDGSVGMLVADGELGQSLVALLSSPGRRESMSRDGLRRASDYSWDRSCEAHELAYRRAMDEWHRSR